MSVFLPHISNAMIQECLTERLQLRLPQTQDVEPITQLANNPKIAEMTASIPSPYSSLDAQNWIEHVHQNHQQGTLLAYVICHRFSTQVMGAISLRELKTGELNLGYWLGEPYWGFGFCTEAGQALIHVANTLHLSPITARHLEFNQPSQNVLLRLGFQKQGKEEWVHRGQSKTFLYYTLPL